MECTGIGFIVLIVSLWSISIIIDIVIDIMNIIQYYQKRKAKQEEEIR